MLLDMSDEVGDVGRDALREAAIMLAARIRIALPYRRAASSDLLAIDVELERLRAAGVRADDAAVSELANLRDTLEILTAGSDG